MRCCAAWERVGKRFDQCSCECVDFHELSQFIASLIRERIAEREAAVLNLPWTQTEKDNALAECRLSQRACVSKKPMLCLHAVTDEEGHPLEDEDESGRRRCTNWCRGFESRTEDERHHAHETILEYVQKAPEDIQWKIDKQDFDEMIATKNLLLDPMVFPVVSAGVLVNQHPVSCSMHVNVCLRWCCLHTLCREQNRLHSQIFDCLP